MSPSFLYPDGRREWFLDDTLTVLHRTDGPAVERTNGIKVWFLNGKKHRTDGPAIEYASGNKYWYLNGKLHRTDGPAVEFANGYKWWYLNGKLHRTDGPAIESPNGIKAWWYLNDERVQMEDVFTDPKDQFWWIMKS